MQRLILIASLLAMPILTAAPSERLLDALQTVESNGNARAIAAGVRRRQIDKAHRLACELETLIWRLAPHSMLARQVHDLRKDLEALQ